MARKRNINSDVDSEFIKEFHAKPKRYKPNTYYRVERSYGKGYSGLGKGLYLGRDKTALYRFYDPESYFNQEPPSKMSKYKGKPKWLDLRDSKKLESFERGLKRRGIDQINSDKVGNIVRRKGYDGIIYYDSTATGEEFVLFNTKKVVKVY